MIVGNDCDGSGGGSDCGSTHPFKHYIYLQAIWFSIKLFNVLLLLLFIIYD